MGEGPYEGGEDEADHDLAVRRSGGKGARVRTVQGEPGTQSDGTAEKDCGVGIGIGLGSAIHFDRGEEPGGECARERHAKGRLGIAAGGTAGYRADGIEVEVRAAQVTAGDEGELVIGVAGTEALGGIGSRELERVVESEIWQARPLIVKAIANAEPLIGGAGDGRRAGAGLTNVSGKAPANLEARRNAVAGCGDEHVLGKAAIDGLRDGEVIGFESSTLRGGGGCVPCWGHRVGLDHLGGAGIGGFDGGSGLEEGGGRSRIVEEG